LLRTSHESGLQGVAVAAAERQAGSVLERDDVLASTISTATGTRRRALVPGWLRFATACSPAFTNHFYNAPMKRRDFLLLRPDRPQAARVLSCRRLYMRYRDALAAVGRGELPQTHPFESEPPAEIDTQTPEELFAALEGELASVPNIRLADTEWLADEDLKRHLSTILDRYRARGGVVVEH
jgi:hypothetical protein